MRRTRKSLTPDTPLAPVPEETLDQFVRQGPMSSEELDAAVRRFKKAIIERALGGELPHHLGYPPGGDKPDDSPNHRNGTGSKTVLTDDGPLPIDVPRPLARRIRRETRDRRRRSRRDAHVAWPDGEASDG